MSDVIIIFMITYDLVMHLRETLASLPFPICRRTIDKLRNDILFFDCIITVDVELIPSRCIVPNWFQCFKGFFAEVPLSLL